jgi:glycolate oxidase FAD binding subunit
MTLRPASVAALEALVPAHPRLRLRGGGTKRALSGAVPEVPTLDLSALAGIVEHTPEECTFTALAGTPIAAIEHVLAAHGQYLPFDPPLAAAGATLGGTVAAGLNGSCRYRYGGVRDFIIGARIVDGRGRLTHSGGKVVKNAAGFLLHQALVGSCGTLGILAELTFKVFPAAESHATMRVAAADAASAAALIAEVQRARFDLEALDLEAPATVWLRFGGYREALPGRVAAVQRVLGDLAEVLLGDDDAAVWDATREFSWVPPRALLVRVPVTLPKLPGLDAALARYDARRRYTVAGNLALIAWSDSPDTLSDTLRQMELTGQMLFGPSGRRFIGAATPNVFEERLRGVMDPDGRFS